jgi:hypothetical protein
VASQSCTLGTASPPHQSTSSYSRSYSPSSFAAPSDGVPPVTRTLFYAAACWPLLLSRQMAPRTPGHTCGVVWGAALYFIWLCLVPVLLHWQTIRLSRATDDCSFLNHFGRFDKIRLQVAWPIHRECLGGLSPVTASPMDYMPFPSGVWLVTPVMRKLLSYLVPSFKFSGPIHDYKYPAPLGNFASYCTSFQRLAIFPHTLFQATISSASTIPSLLRHPRPFSN